MKSDGFKHVLQWGIQHSSLSIYEQADESLTNSDENIDFMGSFSVSARHCFLSTGNLPNEFNVKVYMPVVFNNLRKAFGISNDDYTSSFKKLPNDSDVTGRSGAKFFTSSNKLFFVKTMCKKEVDLFRKSFMSRYYKHIMQYGSVSLLPQFFGMYRVKLENKKIYYLVLRSVFSSHKEIHKKYDLKGSLVERKASEKEKNKKLPTFKDEDFVLENEKISLPNDDREHLLQTLRQDVQLLTDAGLMDYSLLVGIHNNSEGNETTYIDGQTNASELETDNEKFAVQSGDVTYYMAIIDVLTYYGKTKKTAHAYKSVRYGINAEISTVDPEKYRKRFLQFIDSALS